MLLNCLGLFCFDDGLYNYTPSRDTKQKSQITTSAHTGPGERPIRTPPHPALGASCEWSITRRSNPSADRFRDVNWWFNALDVDWFRYRTDTEYALRITRAEARSTTEMVNSLIHRAEHLCHKLKLPSQTARQKEERKVLFELFCGSGSESS